MAKTLSKGIVILMGPIFRKLVLRKVNAIALFPFILVKDSSHIEDKELLDHERIHLKQQIELLIIPFYLIYLTEYLFNRLIGRSHQESYRAISFEKEAYDNQNQPAYLSKRKIFAMWRK